MPSTMCLLCMIKRPDTDAASQHALHNAACIHSAAVLRGTGSLPHVERTARMCSSRNAPRCTHWTCNHRSGCLSQQHLARCTPSPTGRAHSIQRQPEHGLARPACSSGLPRAWRNWADRGASGLTWPHAGRCYPELQVGSSSGSSSAISSTRESQAGSTVAIWGQAIARTGQGRGTYLAGSSRCPVARTAARRWASWP